MLVNFIFILFLLISFFSFGLFFKRYFINSKFSYENSFFHIVFYGIFFLTAISVTFNFFLPLHNIILYIIIFIVLVLSLFSFKNLIKKDLNKILFISIVLSPLSVFMDFGYDSGLYHIPYQVVIQNDKISFGLGNLHMRYGLTTSYNYISALLWKNNFFNLVSSFSTILFTLFFIFIFEKLKNKNIIDNLFAIPALITFPLWYRYAELSISLVDVYYSIFYFFTFYYGVKIIFYPKKYDIVLKNKIFLFLIFLSYAISTKPTAVLLVLFLIFVMITKYKIFYQNIIEIFKNNLFSFIFFILWSLRNFTISSCFFYPIKFSCLNFNWYTKDISEISTSIKLWNSYIFNSFIKFWLNYELVIFIFIIFFTLIVIYFNQILKFILNKRKEIFVICTFTFFIFIFNIEPLKLITQLVQINQISELKFIYIKEALYIIIFYLLAIIFVILTFNSKVMLNNFINFKFYNFLPFLFFTICLAVWLLFGPNPRLGQNLFIIIIPVIFILILDLKTKSIFYLNKYFQIFIFVILLNISFVQNLEKINSKSIFFLKQSAPLVNLQKRETFGYKPLNSENLCWTKKYCHPYEDVLVYKEVFGYKFFKKVKN